MAERRSQGHQTHNQPKFRRYQISQQSNKRRGFFLYRGATITHSKFAFAWPRLPIAPCSTQGQFQRTRCRRSLFLVLGIDPKHATRWMVISSRPSLFFLLSAQCSMYTLVVCCRAHQLRSRPFSKLHLNRPNQVDWGLNPLQQSWSNIQLNFNDLCSRVLKNSNE